MEVQKVPELSGCYLIHNDAIKQKLHIASIAAPVTIYNQYQKQKDIPMYANSLKSKCLDYKKYRL